ncbi:MAG TPA: hypothetical protein VGC72_16200 [Candidatus Elarobacter sp.]|jgi:hypothetical protein
MDPFKSVAGALLGVGAVGFIGGFFTLAAYYKSIPRSAALMTRASYCLIAAVLCFTAFLAFGGGSGSDRLLSVVLLCSTLLNLAVIGRERFVAQRAQRSAKARN